MFGTAADSGVQFLGDTAVYGRPWSDADSTLVVDYVTQPSGGWPSNSGTSPAPADWNGNLWPTAPTCPSGNMPTVVAQFAVNVDPVNFLNQTYELGDTIALRNAPRCT